MLRRFREKRDTKVTRDAFKNSCFLELGMVKLHCNLFLRANCFKRVKNQSTRHRTALCSALTHTPVTWVRCNFPSSRTLTGVFTSAQLGVGQNCAGNYRDHQKSCFHRGNLLEKLRSKVYTSTTFLCLPSFWKNQYSANFPVYMQPHAQNNNRVMHVPLKHQEKGVNSFIVQSCSSLSRDPVYGCAQENTLQQAASSLMMHGELPAEILADA